MALTLKSTILASAALAGILNLGHFAVAYSQQAQASFNLPWTAPAVTPAPRPISDTKAPVVATPDPSLTATSAPAPADPVAAAATKLTAAGLKPTYAASYLDVEAKTGTPWELLAAVHMTETGQRGDTAVKSYAGASGPMQFMPATFAHYAMDGDGNGTKDITDLDDALLTAGRYLAAGGADKGTYNTALYHYNHSNAYVSHVLGIARRLGL